MRFDEDKGHFVPISEYYKMRRGTFYVLFIDDFKGMNDRVYAGVVDGLDWAFCDNEHRFRQFMRTFDSVISGTEHHVEVFEHCNWQEFVDAVRETHIHLINEDMYINMDTSPIMNIPIYYNETMMGEYTEVRGEVDIINEEFKYDWAEMLPILESGYLIKTEDLKVVDKLVRKIIYCYTFILELIIANYNSDGLPEEWFNRLPDNVKVWLTKEADFPKLFDDIQEPNLINDGYLFLIYLERALEDLENKEKR